MGIEGQNFSAIENQPLNNEIQNDTPDNLEQISAFFESHDFDTSYLQNSYEAFSPEQKNIILQAYQEIQKNPDLLMEIMELPYDEDSFIIFKESLELYISFDTTTVKNELETDKNNVLLGSNNLDKEENNLDKEENNLDKEENNLDKEENNLEKSREIISGLIGNYPDFFENKLSIESSDEEIKNFFGNANNVEDFLNNIRENNPEEFEKVYRKLENVQKLGIFEVAGLKPLEEYKNATEIPKITGGTEVVKYGLDTSQFHISRVEGDSLIYGDQKIDFGENPPVKYIKNGNFELKSTELDYKVDKQLRSDIFVLEHKIPQIDEKISGLENQKLQSMDYSVNMQKVTNFNQETLDFLFEQTLKDENNPLKNEIKNAIEVVGGDNNSQNTEKLKSLLIENSKKKENEINILLTELNSQKHLAELKLDTMKDKLDAMREAFKQKVLEKDEKVKDVLNLINQIGFNIIPQEIVNNVFSKISESNPVVVGNNVITGIDLNTMDFTGDFNPTLGDGGPNDPNTRNVLIQLMNKMITGNEDIPAVISSYSESGDMQFKTSQDSQETMTREELKGYVANSIGLVGGNPINLIDKNLKSTNSQEK